MEFPLALSFPASQGNPVDCRLGSVGAHNNVRFPFNFVWQAISYGPDQVVRCISVNRWTTTMEPKVGSEVKGDSRAS